MKKFPFELHGHRGARGYRPENTLASFKYALAQGVSALEIDVGITKDDVPIVHHDYTLSPHLARRNGKWIETEPPLRSLALAELAEYDIGRLDPDSAYATDYPSQRAVDGERIPTLADVLELALARGNDTLRFNIEAKSTPLVADITAPPELIAECMLRVIDDAAIRERCIVQSFDWRVVLAVQKLAPGLNLGLTTVSQPWYDTLWRGRPEKSPWLAGYDLTAFGGSLPRLAAELGASEWLPYFGEVTPDNLDEAHALGVRVIVWTVNETDDMQRLIAMGVDGITTDYPDRLRAVAAAQGISLPAPAPTQQ
ncbi:MAG: glycerophosphodiester phosphodiesterase [Gammaproteobacteria bacterium]|nr:glycerophosphodiester phosphodiesterase [Gammaproteobacteria bacterium]